MSKRKTKVIAFNVSSGTFKTVDEATKEANAIKIWLQRLCEKKGYSCKVIIGVSKHNPRVGEIKAIKSGKRGRPTYEFERTSNLMKPAETKPHLHLVIYANPCDMICSLLAKHLNNKYKQKVVWFNDCFKYVNEAVEYVLKQSLKLRKVEVDNSNILSDDELGFYAAVDRVNNIQENQRIAFTYTKPVEVLPKLDIKTFIKDLRERKTLHCNTLINIYSRYYIDRVYNLYVYQLFFNRALYKNIHTFIHTLYTYLIQRRMIPP